MNLRTTGSAIFCIVLLVAAEGIGVLIQDGDVLTGGSKADHFKLVLRTNCECFVYIVTVDGRVIPRPRTGPPRL